MARFARSAPRAVVPLSERAAAGTRRDIQLGALARSHALAARLGLVVPESWVVLADAFRHVVHVALPPGHDPASLARAIHRPLGVERAAEARRGLGDVVLEKDLEREIDAAFRALTAAGSWGIAVRASALVPDMAVARAAGLSRTIFGVVTREALGLAIREIWALGVSETALSYLRSRKIRDPAMAVLLEPVVPAHTSVTLYTDARAVRGAEGPPPSAEAGPRIVVATRGLGSSESELVGAEVVYLGRDGAVRARRPPAPASRLEIQDGGLVRAPPKAAADPPEGLDGKRLAELSEIARRVDEQGPLEVRCVVPLRGDIVVTELVPLEHPGRPAGGAVETLWGRLAPAESSPDPLTPLSRHFVVEPSIERLERALGPEAPRSSRVLGAIATVRGRPYLDLSMVAVRARPAEPEGLLARLDVAGAQWIPGLALESPPRISLARVGLRLAQVATEQRALTDEVTRFERDAERARRWLSEMDLAILPDDALGTTLFEVREFLARAHRLHSQATASVVSAHALVTSLLSTTEPVRAPALAHAMTAGAGVCTSRLPSAFCHLAAILRLDQAAQSLFDEGRLPAPSDVPEGAFARGLRRFLDSYGDRGLVESELAEPRFAEAPLPLLALLGATLRGETVDPDIALGKARAMGDRALAAASPRLSFFETRLVRDLVTRLRELLRLRERCRARLAHGLSLMRTVALDVDRRLRRLDPTLGPGAAFLLGLDELSTGLRLYRTDLGPLVRARQADLSSEQAAPEPPPVFRGTPHPLVPAVDERMLRGIAASPGVGSGKVVRVGPRLEGLEHFAPGDVVVVRSLEQSLSPLYFHARAVVAELGTPLSSSSVVARDAAIPVVTAVPGAWVSLRDGSIVRVDGDEGTVETLELART